MQVGYLTNKPQYANEMADIIRLFYGEIDLRVNPITIEKLDLLVKENILENKLGWQFFYEVEGENYEKTAPFPQKGKGNREIILKRYEKRYGKQFLYEILKEKTGIQLPWGSLTGIRPARLVYEQLEAGYNLDRSMENVIELFDLTEDKADLLKKVVAFQQKMEPPHERGVSLYIGIPFCTTRCSYCTFSSGEIGNGELVAPYMKALLWEMKACEKLIKEKGLKVRTLYVGGGTPTALPSSQLKALIDQIKKYFPSL